MQAPVAVALIGCGGLAGRYFHAPLLAVNTSFDVRRLVQRTPTINPELACIAPGATYCRTLDDVLADPTIELVVLATPDDAHYEFGLAALRCGKNVLIDKPFTVTLRDGEALLAAAVASGALCMPFQNRRYDADFLTVAALLRDGRLGTLTEYTALFDRFRPEVASTWKEQDRGSLQNLGPHMIDQAGKWRSLARTRWNKLVRRSRKRSVSTSNFNARRTSTPIAVFLFGEPTRVWADIAIARSGGTQDDFFELHLFYDATTDTQSCSAVPCRACHAHGIVRPPRKAVLRSSMLVADNAARFIVHGDRGSFVKGGLDVQEGALRSGGVVLPAGPNWGEEPSSAWGRLTLADGKGRVLSTEALASARGRYQAVYEGIAKALRSGDSRPLAAQEITPAQILATLRVMDAAIRSASASSAVSLTPVSPDLVAALTR